MTLDFHTTLEDYQKFFHYYFRRNKLLSLIVAFLFWTIAGNILQSSNPQVWSFFLVKFLVAFCCLIIVFVFIPNWLQKLALRRLLGLTPSFKPNTLTLNEEGITIASDEKSRFYKWEALREAEFTKDFVWITLFPNLTILIPAQAFSTEPDVINFVATIKHRIGKEKPENTKRKIRNLYYWGFAGIIPNVGVFIGIFLVIKGFQYKVRGLIATGLAGVLFTFFFWKFLFPLMNHDDLSKFSQIQLNEVVKEIEFYKVRYGHYPDSLPQLKSQNKFFSIVDPMDNQGNKLKAYFIYENLGDKYMLRSRGKDGVPFTADDLFPVISSNDNSTVGWVKSK